MKQQLIEYLSAGYSCIALTTTEEARADTLLSEVAAAKKFSLFTWDCSQGVRSVESGKIVELFDGDNKLDPSNPHNVPAFVLGRKRNEPAIIIAHDYQPFMGGTRDDADPILVRRVKEAAMHGQSEMQYVVFVGCYFRLPREIEKLVLQLDMALPDRDTIATVIREIATSAKIEVAEASMEPLVDAALGMTTMEVADAAALSVIQKHGLCPKSILDMKVQAVRKGGLLEVMAETVKMDEIGGLDALKASLMSKRKLFSRAAREYGLPTPRGCIAVGSAGSGKSLTAVASASVFGIPLLRLEAGRLFASLVGESEGNWRKAFDMAKAISPCVFFIDEVDGLFSASQGGTNDGGTTQRVLKAILQDMQFNGEGIFFFFTANNIDHLPSPLLDRLDVWSVDLPTHRERSEIWRIHIAKRKRDPEQFDINLLAASTDGYSGRQIEAMWIEAMTCAFNHDREPTSADCLSVVKDSVPTSELMKEEILARRKRLKNRSRAASIEDPQDRDTRRTLSIDGN